MTHEEKAAVDPSFRHDAIDAIPLSRRIGALVVSLVAAALSLAACGDDATIDMMPNARADCGVPAVDDGGLVDAPSPAQADAGLDSAADADGAGHEPATGKLLLFGGTGGGDTRGDTWLFDGKVWAQFNGPGPSRRSNSPAMATLNGKAVLFGGAIMVDGGPLTGPDGGHYHTEIGDDTWAFDGAAWTHVAASPSPPARDSAVMSTLDGKLVLFGGQNQNAAPPTLVDTWTFDATGFATGWTKQTTTAWPVSPISASMAPLNGKLVLFGGSTDSPEGYTWTYDGTNWVMLAASGPAARIGAVMARLDGRLVLFGGFDKHAFRNLDDTWTFDGVMWTQFEGSGPSARANSVMAPLNGKLVLFGGFDGRDQDDTWTFDGRAWTRLNVSGPPGRWCAAMTSL